MPEINLRTLLACRPCGLLTDIDGTISSLAPTPDAARVSPVARRHLATLARHLAVVAVVSGRAAADAVAMVGLHELTYIGNHGFERWRDGVAELEPAAQPYVARIGEIMLRAEQAITLPGVIFENKGSTAAIHYRQAHDQAQAAQQLGAVLHELTASHQLRVTRGHMIWEIRPPLIINKGTAAEALVQELGLHSAIFLGDDRTDADAFATLRRLRERGACATLNVGVLTKETPAVVREQADQLVHGVTGVEQFLEQLVALVTDTAITR